MNSYIYIFPVSEYGDNGEYINLTIGIRWRFRFHFHQKQSLKTKKRNIQGKQYKIWANKNNKIKNGFRLVPYPEIKDQRNVLNA